MEVLAEILMTSFYHVKSVGHIHSFKQQIMFKLLECLLILIHCIKQDATMVEL